MESPTKTVQIEMESRGVRTPDSTADGVPSRTVMRDSVTEQPPSAPAGDDVGLMTSRYVESGLKES